MLCSSALESQYRFSKAIIFDNKLQKLSCVINNHFQVFHDRFYSSSSVRDVGSLFRLKHSINRTNVKSDFVHNVKATEDFLSVVLYAYVIAATKTCKGVDDNSASVLDVANQIVSKWIVINLDDAAEDVTNSVDMTYNHATDFLSLGLLWHGFHDAIREGDGDRIIRYWKFLLPIFKEKGHLLLLERILYPDYANTIAHALKILCMEIKYYKSFQVTCKFQ